MPKLRLGMFNVTISEQKKEGNVIMFEGTKKMKNMFFTNNVQNFVLIYFLLLTTL